MMNKASIDQYFSIKETVAKEAESLLTEVNNIEHIPGYKYLYFEDIEGGYIEYFGEETWQYGGYEVHRHSLPLELLYDPEAKKRYISELEEKAQQKLMQDAEYKLRQQKLKREREKAQYERLKKQFEGN